MTKMPKMLINIPRPMKAKLDVLREQGTSAAGLIRHLLQQHFNQTHAGKKGRG